jgi:hypothetical protein
MGENGEDEVLSFPRLDPTEKNKGHFIFTDAQRRTNAGAGIRFDANEANTVVHGPDALRSHPCFARIVSDDLTYGHGERPRPIQDAKRPARHPSSIEVVNVIGQREAHSRAGGDDRHSRALTVRVHEIHAALMQ